jgi:hypothetical protein
MSYWVWLVLFAAAVVAAVGASVDALCGEVVADWSDAGGPAPCCSPVLVDCWPSVLEPPAPDELSEVAVDGVAGEPLSPGVAPEPVPAWLASALWLA